MTFLPIVDRELRLAARKRSTFWLRVIAAVVAGTIGAGLMTLCAVGAFTTVTLGGALFGILTWMALGAALASGPFFTSDCLSEEKREGTLGFLFLTDLRGYDVAGGKLLATSLRGCFALLAIFPILATTLLMGGVTGLEFWQRMLALLNALTCSLAAGLFVSAISRDSHRAMAGTLCLLLLWLTGGLIADGTLSLLGHRGPNNALFRLSSPLYLFSIIGPYSRIPFWRGLLLNQAIAWLLFALTCLLVPRTWQERRAAGTASSSSSWSYTWRYGRANRRAALRRRLLGRNAILWLACRERRQWLGVWGIALLVASVFTALLVTDLPAQVWVAWHSVSWMFLWLIYLWAASQASRFFIEARRSGLIELLLAAPVSVRDIVDGQWRALLRLFAAPVALVLAVQFAGGYLAATQSGKWVPPAARAMLPTFTIAMVGSAGTVLAIAANLVAICWFGMWMGMTSKSSNLAILKTLAFVQLIPSMAITFASGLAIPLLLMPLVLKGGLTSSNLAKWVTTTFANWVPLVTISVGTLLALGKDIGFVVWSRRTLLTRFREQASRSLGLPRHVPVPASAPVPAPPPIPTQ